MNAFGSVCVQVPKVGMWGREFIYVPTPRRKLGDTIKIIAYDDDTTIDLIGQNGVDTITIGSRFRYFR